jgi:hypothetical protein
VGHGDSCSPWLHLLIWPRATTDRHIWFSIHWKCGILSVWKPCKSQRLFTAIVLIFYFYFTCIYLCILHVCGDILAVGKAVSILTKTLSWCYKFVICILNYNKIAEIILFNKTCYSFALVVACPTCVFLSYTACMLPILVEGFVLHVCYGSAHWIIQDRLDCHKFVQDGFQNIHRRA